MHNFHPLMIASAPTALKCISVALTVHSFYHNLLPSVRPSSFLTPTAMQQVLRPLCCDPCARIGSSRYSHISPIALAWTTCPLTPRPPVGLVIFVNNEVNVLKLA